MDDQQKITGGCLCGAVRYRVTSKPLAPLYCHCGMCRKSGGGPFAAAATVLVENLEFYKGRPNAYESSPGFVRLFCRGCGASIGMTATESPKLIAFWLNCLDDPNAVKPECHQYTKEQVSWCDVNDNLPRHPGVAPENGDLWAKYEGWETL